MTIAGPTVQLGSRMLLLLWPWVRPYWRGMVVMLVADILALVAQAVAPFVIAGMIDGPIAHGDRDGIWRPAGILLLLAVAQTIFYAARRWLTLNMVDAAMAVRRDLYRHAQRLPALYHDSHGSGVVLARLIGDVGQIADQSPPPAGPPGVCDHKSLAARSCRCPRPSPFRPNCSNVLRRRIGAGMKPRPKSTELTNFHHKSRRQPGSPSAPIQTLIGKEFLNYFQCLEIIRC